MPANNKNICTVNNCGRVGTVKGYCNKHYLQVYRHGKVFKITNQDFNEVIDKERYYELVLTDVDMQEIGRAKIDKEDLEKVRNIGRWHLQNGYVICGDKSIFMHRLILDANDDQQVDHKKVGFKYKSDNRKKNLRLCNNAQNSYNKRKQSNNKSGYKGVSWHKGMRKWCVDIKINRVRVYTAYFDDVVEASKAYNREAKKLHGKFYKGN